MIEIVDKAEQILVLFHLCLSLVSIIGITWLTASSDRYRPKILKYDYVHEIVEHHYNIQRYAVSAVEPIL